MRIEICGGIGAGKTTIAGVLAAQLNCEVISEVYRTVPFWEHFYKDPERYSFEKNVSFALAHGERLRASLHLNPAVSDFALFQDLAYAELSRDAEELHVVSAIYARMERLVDSPSVLVRVTCRLERQLERIEQRGRIAEKGTDIDYITGLNFHVEEKAKALAQRVGAPYFELDTTEWNENDPADDWSSRLETVVSTFYRLPSRPSQD